ncbi:hypothetical protein [Trinickia sp.]|uniref:hypothetical protein n=1 Tax=Trinickia sp. TaxID=2571163 RepID=UPI003F8231B4
MPLPHDQDDRTTQSETMKPSNSASYKARSVSAISFAVAFLFTSVQARAGLLPSGGQFVAGIGSFNRTDTQLTINQTSSRGIIDWTGFGTARHR